MLRLVLLGKTGSGKSLTGNTILNDDSAFVAALSGVSVTRECSVAFGKNPAFTQHHLLVVDTPGLCDTGSNPERVAEEVGQCVRLSVPGPHAMLFVSRVGRFTQEDADTVAAYEKMFGPEMWKYLIIVFTGGDDLAADNITVEDLVATTAPAALRDIVSKSGRFVAINNRGSKEEKEEQVRLLLDCVDKMVETNGGEGHYTNQMYMEAVAAMEEEKAQKYLKLLQEKEAEEARIKAEEDARNQEIIRQQQLLQQQEQARLAAAHAAAVAAAAAANNRRRRKWYQF